MAYQPQIWVDGEAGETPLTAARMNYMEAGIEAASIVTPVLILGLNDPIPAGTPAGTLIARSDAGTTPTAPTSISLTASPGDGTVTVNLAGGAGATSFALYRGTVASGDPIAVSFPYTDTVVSNGTAVSYIATASNAVGTVTSPVVTVTPNAPSGRPQVVTSSATVARAQVPTHNLTIGKPTGVLDGDLLVAVVHSQTAPTTPDDGNPLPLPAGWQMLSNRQEQVLPNGTASSGLRSTYIAALPVPSASSIAATANWTFYDANVPNGAGRMIGTIFRVVGADLSLPIIANSGTPTEGVANPVDGTVNAARFAGYSVNTRSGLTIIVGNAQVTSPNLALPYNLSGSTKVLEYSTLDPDDTSVSRSVITVGTSIPDDAPASTMTQGEIFYWPTSSAASRGLQGVTLRAAGAVAAPSAVTLTATAGPNKVTLTMTGGSGATSVALYRSATPTGTPIATALPYEDVVAGGTEYSYVVTASNATGTTTSNVATATPTIPTGATVTSVTKRADFAARNNSAGFTVPAGVTANDLCILVTAGSGGYNLGTTITLPSPWVQRSQNDPAFNNSQVSIWTRIGTVAGQQITYTQSDTAGLAVYAVWLNTGGANDVAIAGTVGGRAGASSTVTTIPGITTTKANQIVLAVASERTTATPTTVSSTSPALTTDYYLEEMLNGTSTISSTSLLVGHFTQATLGATGNVAITYSGGSGNGGGLLLALP